MTATAVVLFNLGGPDSPAAVRPFLRNLFSDPAIVAAPRPVRWCLARLIAARRAATARDIYRRIGGASPLPAETQKQADALESRLRDLGSVRSFVAMRYWKPFVEDAARRVAAFGPDRVVLLPLYPQFSTTTTASSLAAWRRGAEAAGLRAPVSTVCCYPVDPGFAAAHAAAIDETAAAAPAGAPWRLLFSAHGLPKRIVARGDPYPRQVERTAAAVAARLRNPDVDRRVCYQSRVGPLEWIGPSTDDEIRRAGAEGLGVVIAPISFVSEHSETLVELDIEYRALAERSGVPFFARVPALGVREGFIDALAGLVRAALRAPGAVVAGAGGSCPEDCRACPRRSAAP